MPRLRDSTPLAGYYQMTKWLPTRMFNAVGKHYETVDLDADLKIWTEWLRQHRIPYKVIKRGGKVAIFRKGKDPFDETQKYQRPFRQRQAAIGF